MKVALYAGELPPPVFIDRLIHGLARSGMDLVVFGALHGKTIYPYPNVKVVGYSGKFHKAIQLLYYTFLLLLKNPKGKRKLDTFITEQGKNKALQKLKYYPVLYHQPDVFHLQWAKAISEWMWVQEFGMKLVLSLRGAHINYSPIHDESLRLSYETHFPKVNAFHAVSKALSKEGQRYGATEPRIHLVYSGLPLEEFPYEIKKSIPTTLKIVSIGRMHWKKGYTYALDAIPFLQQQNISFQYALLGVQPSEELLFQLNDLNLHHRVTFKDAVPFEQVIQEIQNADVLLLPSVEEGIANVVLEAMALGTLVVTTACGGMTEVVTDGVNGFVVPVRDPKAIAAALVKVSELALEDYQRMTKAARNTIEKNFTEQQMVAAMQKLYQSLETQT